MSTRSLALAALLACTLSAQTPTPRAPAEPMKPLYVLEASLRRLATPALRQAVRLHRRQTPQGICERAGRHLAPLPRQRPSPISGCISGTEGDADNAKWLEDKFHNIGLAEVHQQYFDLPDQWMAQSWTITAASGGKTLELTSAQPAHRTAGTSAEGLDLEAVDAGLATEAELNSRDLKGTAVFFYSTDYFSRHSTISNGAWRRIGDRGAAAIFVVASRSLAIFARSSIRSGPTCRASLGLRDGVAIRDMIDSSKTPPHVKVRLDVKMVPNLKTLTVWELCPA